MSISLTKGQNISLTKEAPGMTKLIIGLGWDANGFDGNDFDLDATAIMLAANGKVRSENDLIFYGKLVSDCGAVTHTGDNKTGDAVGDDEEIILELPKIESTVDKIVIPVSIYSAKKRKQNFGLVNNAYVRIVNADTKEEVLKYDLTEDYSIETSLIFAEIYRKGAEWKFKASGQGFNDGLAGIGRAFGLPLAEEQE